MKAINKADLTPGARLIEKRPSKHTEKLQIIVIKRQYTTYSYSKGRCYTYFIAMTEEGQFYPAANRRAGNEPPLFLDGLMGDYDLSKLKREYKLL